MTPYLNIADAADAIDFYSHGRVRAPRTNEGAWRRSSGRRRSSPPSAAQHLGGAIVGGEERLEVQLGERLAARDTSVYSLRRLADVYRRRDNDVASREADAAASAIRDRFSIAATAPRTS